jgi:hypothetical protein
LQEVQGLLLLREVQGLLRILLLLLLLPRILLLLILLLLILQLPGAFAVLVPGPIVAVPVLGDFVGKITIWSRPANCDIKFYTV